MRRERSMVAGVKKLKSKILAAILLFCDICGDGTVRGAKYCPRCHMPELGDHIRTGRPFDQDIIKFVYWHRPRMVRGKKGAAE